MNNDASYLRAQRSYDAQLPASGPDMDACPSCDDGLSEFSDCCSTKTVCQRGVIICGKCQQPCEHLKCERCDGEGEIDVSAEAEQRRVEAEEHRADCQQER